MTKEQANKFLYRIYRALKENEIRFEISRSLGRLYGALDFDLRKPWKVTISVHADKKQFVSTLVHECVHLVDIELKEKEVTEIEEQLMLHLTDRQLTNLLKRVVLHCTK